MPDECIARALRILAYGKAGEPLDFEFVYSPRLYATAVVCRRLHVLAQPILERCAPSWHRLC